MSLGQLFVKIFLKTFPRKKNSPLFARKIFSLELKNFSRNNFADKHAQDWTEQTFPAVEVAARRNNRNQNHELNNRFEVLPKKFFPRKFFYAAPIFVEEAAEPAADNRRRESEPTVSAEAPRAEQNKKQN